MLPQTTTQDSSTCFASFGTTVECAFVLAPRKCKLHPKNISEILFLHVRYDGSPGIIIIFSNAICFLRSSLQSL
ncbi:Protein of unknown function [Pyronema omphalodes CBS 100304]|uniref:Uncharacterized protein n=1 Tax=Pyronema omphalodes (strain CBS 100304) TaxID=1076935 RepID=U4LUG7_PYROM|nr:Protein of unknown function [Pyronema omphalodes CBS 100304]